MAKTVNSRQNNAPTNLNYNGEPLKENEVLVPMNVDDLFIETNVTNPNSIITLSVGGQSFKAVLIAVDRTYASIAKAQYNSWQNDILGHIGHRMKEDSIEDRQEHELPEPGLTASAESIALELTLLVELVTYLIKHAPQLAYATLLVQYGAEPKEFETLLRLNNNRAHIVRKNAETVVKDMLKYGYENVDLKVNKTQNDSYYRQKSQELLDLILELNA